MNAGHIYAEIFMLCRPFVSCLLAFGLPLTCPLARAAEGDVEFNRDVRPILSNKCFECHGPDAATREAGLRLDQSDSATRKSDSGHIAIVPGNVAASELIRRVTSTDPDLRMPPTDSSKQLTPEQIAVLKAWIHAGAQYQQHWAFVPPVPPAVPSGPDFEWAINDIDRFVLLKLHQQNLSPTHEATRETLIRRVAFDVTGLPPTIEQIDMYLADTSPTAYVNMVDRYMNSPAYGEHMARHWLDLARYADTNGYQYDTEREQWVWRDWVIDAYNRNMPFDEFTIQQLAGDLVPNATPQHRLATGFNRNHGITIEGGIIDEEYRTEYVMDRLVTTAEVWMGLTIGCARCHDHKYDPVSQKEFYQLFAFFNQVPERGMRGFTPQEQIPSPLAAARLQELNVELEQLQAELRQPLDIRTPLEQWAATLAASPLDGWQILSPETAESSGGSTLTTLDDDSVLAGGANPRHDVYEITALTNATGITAVRLEALTHASLPGGGPGRHSNSNFVLSEFEAAAVSIQDPTKSRQIPFTRAEADYSQSGYEVAKAIDGAVANSNGWAVDGPTRKVPAAAMFIADSPFGFEAGTQLRFRLRHEANFATHGIGRARLSVTTDPAHQLRIQDVPASIRLAARKAASGRTPEESRSLQEYFLAHHDPRQTVKNRIAAIQKQQAAAFPATMVMQEQPETRETYVLNRGQYNEPMEKVAPGVPSVFSPLPRTEKPNRLGLARWLTDSQHPLTARVAVNRYWQRLFGIGLVRTSEDFGVQGELPSHPKLLDWLSLEFVRSGWNVKHIQRLMLTSATYRQTSHVGSVAWHADPENRLLARGPRMRLDAEEIRDAALVTAGLLVPRLGGKSVYPYQPAGLWLELNNRPGYSMAWPQGSHESLYRRSMYTFWKRTVPSPMLKTFDAPEREFCTVRRSRTNTPLQALLLLNGPQFVEASRHLAQRMILEGGTTLDRKINHGFRLVTARPASTTELAILREAYTAEKQRCIHDPTIAASLLQVGETPNEARVDRIELAAFTSVARLLMNLNEAITKG